MMVYLLQLTGCQQDGIDRLASAAGMNAVARQLTVLLQQPMPAGHMPALHGLVRIGPLIPGAIGAVRAVQATSTIHLSMQVGPLEENPGTFTFPTGGILCLIIVSCSPLPGEKQQGSRIGRMKAQSPVAFLSLPFQPCRLAAALKHEGLCLK